MTDLQPVGFFSDLSYGHAEEGPLSAAVRAESDDWEPSAVGYLEAGTPIAIAMMVTCDELDPARPEIGPLAILTDGTWVWPSDLAYYLGRYHCPLPDEFVTHMRDQDWHVPEDLEVDLDEYEF